MERLPPNHMPPWARFVLRSKTDLYDKATLDAAFRAPAQALNATADNYTRANTEQQQRPRPLLPPHANTEQQQRPRQQQAPPRRPPRPVGSNPPALPARRAARADATPEYSAYSASRTVAGHAAGDVTYAPCPSRLARCRCAW